VQLLKSNDCLQQLLQGRQQQVQKHRSDGAVLAQHLVARCPGLCAALQDPPGMLSTCASDSSSTSVSSDVLPASDFVVDMLLLCHFCQLLPSPEGPINVMTMGDLKS
jgi:hypothetical protein